MSRRRRTLRALAPLLLAPLLAGCLVAPGPTDPLDPGAAGGIEGAVPRYDLRCPDGAPGQGGQACSLLLGGEDMAEGFEPFVAADPVRPGVYAVGVNYAPSVVDAALGVSAEQSIVQRLGMYITQDGGQTWRETFAAPPDRPGSGPGPRIVHIIGDPAMVWDDQGRLHVTALASTGTVDEVAGFVAFAESDDVRTYHTYTDDLGATWSPSVVVHDNGQFQDRNWILRDPATGTLFALWQNVGDIANTPSEERTVEVAWSTDRGATWNVQQEDQHAPCYLAGPPDLVDGKPLFPCHRRGADGAMIVVYTFDPATGDTVLVSDTGLPGSIPTLRRLADGTLAMLAHTCWLYSCDLDTWLALSHDGGATWEPLGTTLAGLVEGEWEYVQSLWAEAAPGPAVALHVLVWLERRTMDPPAGQEEELPVVGPVPPHEVALRHLVLDPSGEVLQEDTLATWTTLPPAVPNGAVPFGGDHFHGLAFGLGGEALLAYAVQRDTHVTVAVPT